MQKNQDKQNYFTSNDVGIQNGLESNSLNLFLPGVDGMKFTQHNFFPMDNQNRLETKQNHAMAILSPKTSHLNPV